MRSIRPIQRRSSFLSVAAQWCTPRAGVVHHHSIDIVCLGIGFHDRVPDSVPSTIWQTGCTPSCRGVCDGQFRQWPADMQGRDNSGDEPAVIDALHAARLVGHNRLDALPLRIALAWSRHLSPPAAQTAEIESQTPQKQTTYRYAV